MKFLHLADLHLGKKVNEYPMIEDQKYILLKILDIIDKENPDAILIAGDVFDRSTPPIEAIELLNSFLNDLAKRKKETFIISGNHDSAERLSFACDLIDKSGIHISPTYDGSTRSYRLKDEYGFVNIYLLPFIKPVQARKALDDEEINSYNDAISAAVKSMNINYSERNVLLTHQFVTGAKVGGSEEISVGGTDEISAEIFDGIDYVALGHIHSPQRVSRDTIRYCGSPLKYSFSEAKNKKSATIVTLSDKGNVEIEKIPLIPKYDMLEIRGKYNELMSKKYYDGLNLDDYYHITLTDEDDIPDAINKLRCVYKKIMKLDYDNKRTRSNATISTSDDMKRKTPLELLGELYEKQNAKPIDEEQKEYASKLIEKIWETEE